MDVSELIERTKQNIWQAISDYGKHTDQTSVMDDCTANFVNQLASDSCYAKQELRELFSKSPVWDAKLDALVINGTRTHNPDYDRVYQLAVQILEKPLRSGNYDFDTVMNAIGFFSNPEANETYRERFIAAIKQLAPKAYTPTRKLSRVFKSLCVALGVADETAGSEFQRLYAQFADELSAKKIGFKLFVSINPAHFITMSNPKCDRRGATLTSCHSFNSTEYSYNNGCTGYARDKVSFIAFTVADPADKETLNNRKTTRQVFAYKPGNGLLLQSRMYNTSGGVYGASEDSKLYRDLIQREISMLENVPNLWKTYPTVGEKSFCVERGDGFGGYLDWEYENFDGKVSIRADHEEDFRSLVVGSYGLCVSCGCETSYGVYCEDCKDGRGGNYCECCEEYVDEELYSVRDRRGNWIEVCEDCRDENFGYCECCGEYWPNDCITEIDDRYYCDSCRDEYCRECYECDDYHHTDNMTEVVNARGDEVLVCEDCRDRYYEQCEGCGEYHIREEMTFVTLHDGDHAYVCENCMDSYEICPHCDTMIERCEDGTCPECGAVIDEKEEDEAV